MSKGYKAKAYENFESSGYIAENKHYYNDISGKRRSESMIGITTSMMLSPAWRELNEQQKCLYMVAKYQYHSAPDRPCNNSDNEKYKGSQGKKYIYLNIKLAGVHGIYSNGKNNKGYYAGIKALVEHGFLKPIEKENNQRTIYELIDEWTRYEPGTKFMETNTKQHRWEWVRIEMV